MAAPAPADIRAIMADTTATMATPRRVAEAFALGISASYVATLGLVSAFMYDWNRLLIFRPPAGAGAVGRMSRRVGAGAVEGVEGYSLHRGVGTGVCRRVVQPVVGKTYFISFLNLRCFQGVQPTGM